MEEQLRVYPEDACYKQYREFSPAEKKVDQAKRLQTKTDEHQKYFEEQRKDVEDTVKEPDISVYKEMM